MISIQELGLSILSDNPNKLYIIGGTEYGVKDKYIEHLKSVYGTYSECLSVDSLVSMLSVKRLIPLPRQLFVVRYDESFVSSVNEAYAAKLKKLNIPGTLLCLYSQEKSIAKLDKYLPEYVSVVEGVNPNFIEKYLHSDFPQLDDRSIKVATKACSNYGHARNICKSFSSANKEDLAKMTEEDLIRLVGCSSTSNEQEIQLKIACKDFRGLVNLLDKYPGELDTLVYTVLQTMIELEKILSSKYSDSALKECAKNWKIEDVYYMFINAYSVLSELRSNTSSDTYSRLIYLFSLLTFQSVPSVEVMNAF